MERIERDRRLSAKIPWNVEVKNGTGWEEALPRLFTMLDRQVTARRIAVVVAGGKNTATAS